MTRSSRRIGYIMSRFPKLTETFVLYEILSLQQQGVNVELYPLHREKCDVVHPEAEPLVDRARFNQLFSVAVLAANLHWLTRRPLAYIGAWCRCLWATLGSRRYFIGAFAAIPLAARIARQMEHDQIDHIHAHFASHPALAAFVIGRLTGIPYSFTAHGSDLHRERRMLREKMQECQFAVAISEYNRQWIARECGARFAEKTHVIHCGIDPQSFEVKRPGRFAASEGQCQPLQVLCIGTLHEVKGQSYLLQACAKLAAQGVAVHLHFVGDGADRPMLEALATDLNFDHCTFHGHRCRPQVIGHLAEADVVAAPSVLSSDGRREGIPVVLMEAMASGLPVVASRISGIPELVEDQETGLLAPPRDAAALAEALQTLARDPQLRIRMGAAGRRRVTEHFNLHAETQRLASLFGCEVDATAPAPPAPQPVETSHV